MWSQCIKLPACLRVDSPVTRSGLVEAGLTWLQNEINKLLDSKGRSAVSCLISLQLVSGNNAVKFAKPRELGWFSLFVYCVGLNLCVGR